VNLLFLVTAVILCGVEYALLGQVFDISAVERGVMAALTFASLLFAVRRGVYQRHVVLLVGATAFVALTCSLGSEYRGDSPIRLNFVLGPWLIFLLAAGLAGAALWTIERNPTSRQFPRVLAAAFAVNWVLLSINVAQFQDWLLENALTVPFALLILLTHGWFRLSNISYGLIFVYMMLHIIGTHYTYSEVPFGFWLQDLLNVPRNDYDRIVHFSFGLLMAYPMREVAIRIGSLRGFWALYVPVEFVLAFSAIYEIIEWLIAITFGGDLGVAYLGTQGDPWDAIKDMAVAGLGSVIAMTFVLVVLLTLSRGRFWPEFRESLKVKQQEALGEEALERMRHVE
jgi:putative membrane protein